MRTAAALVVFLVSALWPAAAQRPAVRVQPPIFADTGAQGRANDLLAAYLRKRFEALGLRMVLQSDSVDAVEVNFSVMPVGNAAYDAAAVLTIFHCPTPQRRACSRGFPFDWMHYHAYGDLDEVARNLAEQVYSELGSLADVRRWVDSLAKAPKH
jgi:hypothetical protein